MKITAHFTFDELKCQHCGQMRCKIDSVRRLERLRMLYGSPIRISSGYRCPTHNERVSKTGRKGPHTKGQAFDIPVYGRELVELVDKALTVGFRGFGFRQHGPHKERVLHLDDLPDLPGQPRPYICSY